jgi:hypothetical protein
MSANDLTQDDRLQANREFLQERFPQHKEIFNRIESKYQIDEQAEGVFYKTRDGRSLLKEPEPQYSQIRADAFIAKPPRLSVASQGYGTDSVKSVWRPAVEVADLAMDDERWAIWPDINEATGLILFDVGALDVLRSTVIDALPNLASILIIISDFDYFFANLKSQDWHAFVLALEKNEINVNFRFTRSNAETVSAIRQYIWSKHLIFPDNVLCYFHFVGPQQEQLWQLIRYEYNSLVSGLGFFDDEMGMFAHSMANILKNNGLTLKRSKKESRYSRAVIVGSGPSLDRSLEAMRPTFSESFVIASGTALEPLLDAGIRVDACVILERGKEVPDVFRDMSNRVDLHNIDVVASSTVAPDLRDLFRTIVYFFRPGLNVYAGFGADFDNTLSGCDPTVTNTALALASFLNFDQCLLVGVDMGSLAADSHHSEKTAYHTAGLEWSKHNIPARASHGGMAFTQSVFHWARQSMENLIKAQSQRQIINCSDGVFIEHAVTVPPEVAGAIDQFYPCEAKGMPDLEDFSQGYDVNRLQYDRQSFDELVVEVRAVLQDFAWETRTDMGRRLHALLWQSGNRSAVPMMIRGSLYLLIWHALSVLGRLDDDEREAANIVFRDGLLEALDYMVSELRAQVFDELDKLEIDKTS